MIKESIRGEQPCTVCILNYREMNMNVWLLLAWICCAAVTGLSYDTVVFRVTDCNKEIYRGFLQTLRTQLSTGTEKYDIPLLPIPSTSIQDLLLVKHFDWDGKPITLVLNRANVYVIAYEAKNVYYLLADTPNNPTLYGTNPHKLSFVGSYEHFNMLQENIEKILIWESAN
ncbi:protein ABC transporter 1, mitochondrial [Iris pallida]|uniref:rRNA N-glycosylase n=1 Tax=Iris pallida TaxID=29817 RepID=A0AAX6G5T2_IRIPA|nr:protein ABC transporter 1, mitochondrial [Iris pallida]